MICDKCMKAAKRCEETFTIAERMYLLSSSVSMMRSVLGSAPGHERSQDKLVASSVITKLLLSFPAAGRDDLARHFKKVTGIEITIGSCAHGAMLAP